ncbi:hypothetical protein BN137_2308 [Cronobacter condimenti 1330]|uniref:Uncharacterized protein n=1 Tax=Cronobacter condimenti 1330 TaxID=1073999 RepID=K8AFA9_9ENTR|nr:hypothetical protein BN137_2308 [Cronobacter condimenti 1330]
MVRFYFLTPSRFLSLRFFAGISAVTARFFIPGTSLALPLYHRCCITQF